MKLPIWVYVLALFALTAAFGAVQTWRANYYQEGYRESIRKISEIKRGVMLTESLRYNNSILTEERNDVLGEINDSAGHDTPLPPDMRRVLERMRDRPSP